MWGGRACRIPYVSAAAPGCGSRGRQRGGWGARCGSGCTQRVNRRARTATAHPAAVAARAAVRGAHAGPIRRHASGIHRPVNRTHARPCPCPPGRTRALVRSDRASATQGHPAPVAPGRSVATPRFRAHAQRSTVADPARDRQRLGSMPPEPSLPTCAGHRNRAGIPADPRQHRPPLRRPFLSGGVPVVLLDRLPGTARADMRAFHR